MVPNEDPTRSAPDDPITPADTLPEVSPPTAGFILQLFVIPAIIVLIIIMVWMLFSWLAHMGGDPRSYITEMKQNKANSWQQAYNLSEELRQDSELRANPELAKELALFLNELLDQPLPPPESNRKDRRDPRSEEVQRRGFLCKTLGEFSVADDAMPVLIRAAKDDGSDDEDVLRVRLMALEAIALLAYNAPGPAIAEDEGLLTLLLAASRSDDPKVALRGVTALGSVGGDRAIARLEEVLDEPHHVDVHYNAATRLAQHGNAASIDILLEMLDPTQKRGLQDEPNEAAKDYKRARILLNGLRAARQLAQENDTFDRSALTARVEALADADVPKQIQLEAAETLSALRKKSKPRE